MIYIVDNISNYLIYLFIIYCGFRIKPRKNRFFIGISALIVLYAGAFNAYYDVNSPIIYIVWSVLSICLFFEERLGHLIVLSAALMYFTGIVDTFSVMLIQVMMIGGGISNTNIAWWMESAYLLSFVIYLLAYLRILKKHEVYLCDIEFKYKFALLVQGSIFQLFYDFVFFNENHIMYGWDAYVVFFISIVGGIYSVFLTLSLAVKNILSNRQNRELQSFMYMQKQQYDYQLQQSVAVRRFKHDLVNHIGVLRELMNEKKTEEAKEYIDTIWNIQDEFDLKIHTGDSFLDVIINYYSYLAIKENIEFVVLGRLTEKMPLEMFDITTLMGNILQNAVEATVKAEIPRIRVELVEHRKEIFIVVSNSIAERINTKANFFMTSKKDKESHGFGLKNIISTVEKYHGEYYMESIAENKEVLFKISIAIPVAKTEEKKRMKIGIVEDEAIWRDKIQSIIEQYCRDKTIPFQINSYSSGKEFMKNPDTDLLFLDIELAEGEDGLWIAGQLMHYGNKSKICFLTSHMEQARLGYKVNAFRYIDKKHLEEIGEALDSFLKTKIQERIIFCNTAAGMCIRINLNELVLIETYGRKLRYLMLDGSKHLCEGQISETARSLFQFGFFQIQRSYIVNLKYIEKTDSRKITLCNGLEVAIGRTHSNEFKKAFFKWRMLFDN